MIYYYRRNWKLCSFIFIIPVVLSLVFIVLSSQASPTVKPERILKHANSVGPKHLGSLADHRFSGRILERTGGRIKIQVYDGASLVKGKEALEALRNNVIDFSDDSLSYWPGDLPFSSVACLMPFGWGWEKVVDVIKATNPVFNEELNRHNAMVLWSRPLENGFFSRVPIDPLNPRFDGLKVRTFGPTLNQLVKILGGHPVGMASSELAVAMATGVIDACFTSYDRYFGAELYEHAKYVYMSDAVLNIGSGTRMNLTTFNSLSANDQKIILEEAADIQRWCVEVQKKEVEEVPNKLSKKGIKPTIFTPEQNRKWQQASKPIWDKLLTDFPNKGKKFMDLLRKVGALK